MTMTDLLWRSGTVTYPSANSFPFSTADNLHNITPYSLLRPTIGPSRQQVISTGLCFQGITSLTRYSLIARYITLLLSLSYLCGCRMNFCKFEGPATGHLDTGFSWFPCVYKQMLRWFLRFQVATTCFSCSPPVLNLVLTIFMFVLTIFVFVDM